MTCAVRESAEMKIWKRLRYIRTLAKYENRKIRIGVLGCMAERLKEQLLSGQCPTSLSREDVIDQSNCSTSQRPRLLSIGADFVCGPDAYRDLPRLIEDSYAGIQGASVALSMEETYADVAPIRLCSVVGSGSCQTQSRFSPFAFLSVMRGCDNMCTYCIVPFVRGRERSRPLNSILDEARQLFDEGVREITLLGQNVNSYCDRSGKLDQSVNLHQQTTPHCNLTPGFRTVYRLRNGGLRFADLLDQVSRISPELRIRFTSPHPKDFPTEVLQLIGERPNICSHLHLPAQSGSEAVLERMGRGYTPTAYRNLIDTVRTHIPDVAITSDFIAGFCGETEEDHSETVRLIRDVGYSFIFCYPYSMREKTRAHRRMHDDVPKETKSRRHLELKAAGREISLQFNQSQLGNLQLVLVEGTSRRSPSDMYGRNDFNTKVILSRVVPTETVSDYASVTPVMLEPGDYVAVEICSANSQTLHGRVLRKVTLKEFYEQNLLNTNVNRGATGSQ
ncbi:hypothetical protein EG68_06690 [Paragonimus skrjabini miyazakii]|uniref:Uncharacterized protein n=1 Tax=Paragonimus skrjabini miyazakii TaxID=59628 RepID=A0A8S9YSQ4_9TREM|nr:hypothetical protein EG68_06690 [Paragonimus skrjabini miyazakii]